VLQLAIAYVARASLPPVFTACVQSAAILSILGGALALRISKLAFIRAFLDTQKGVLLLGCLLLAVSMTVH
jgi:hypothetical protein